jgi:glucose-1-phosphate adenylyltransferase
MEKLLAIILAGGNGSRLKPLTLNRAKPAVPFGGKYRIIDFTLANCLHSGIRRILVLTQYKSHSLQKHLRDGWSIFNPELGEYITAVPPQMRINDEWYQGTADAIYQNLYLLERSTAEWIIILSGDHIYRMDYAAMFMHHLETEADVTLACMEVPHAEASGFGIVRVDPDARVTEFQEKPENPEPLPDNPAVILASMGIYLFSRHKLLQILHEDHQRDASSHDFGRDILPRLVTTSRVCAYQFGGTSGRVTQDRYWRDVGTLDAYYNTSMDLLEPNPSINLYQPDWLIWTYQEQSPPARTIPGDSGTEGIIINSILAAGVIISGGSVNHSILFSGVFVGDESLVEDAILFSDVRLGRDVKIRRCIIDKNVEVPEGEAIGYDPVRDKERFTVTEEGVVVVPMGYQFKP